MVSVSPSCPVPSPLVSFILPIFSPPSLKPLKNRHGAFLFLSPSGLLHHLFPLFFRESFSPISCSREAKFSFISLVFQPFKAFILSSPHERDALGSIRSQGGNSTLSLLLPWRVFSLWRRQ